MTKPYANSKWGYIRIEIRGTPVGVLQTHEKYLNTTKYRHKIALQGGISTEI